MKYVFAHASKIMLGSVLFMFALSTPVLTAQYMSGKIESLSSQLTAEQELLTGIRWNVPENTKATGSGIAYLYARLGWENPLKLCDTPAVGSSTAAMKMHEDVIRYSQEPVLLVLNDNRLDLWNEVSDRYHVPYRTNIHNVPVVYAIPKEGM